jgi:hypothetical protein
MHPTRLILGLGAVVSLAACGSQQTAVTSNVTSSSVQVAERAAPTAVELTTPTTAVEHPPEVPIRHRRTVENAAIVAAVPAVELLKPVPAEVHLVERHGTVLRVYVDGLLSGVGPRPCGTQVSVSMTNNKDGSLTLTVFRDGQLPSDRSCSFSGPFPGVVEVGAPAGLRPHAVIRVDGSPDSYDPDATQHLAEAVD